MRDSISSWQKILSQGFSSAAELLQFLELPIEHGSPLAERQFKTRVPRGFAARMEKANRFDPLLMQVLAVEEENQVLTGYSHDPLEEKQANPVKGLIHKYHGRVLLTLTGSCAVNCRYCFRRHFPYQENNPGRQGWQAALDYIAKDPSIHEVILSGGDPLLASDASVQLLIEQLEKLEQINTLRIHSRVPIVLPERITPALLNALQTSRLSKVIVLHSNHPNELNEDVRQACQSLKQAGCQLLNQSVLLAGVNDCPETLAALSHKLFSYHILPYYLHLLDKVQGAGHFDLPLQQAQSIYHQLQAKLPGYLLPRLSKEEPGKASKSLIL